MDITKKQLEFLKPKSKPTVMKLVEEAGINVSDWENGKGGAAKASSNPKYCYEWFFESDNILIFNIWFSGIIIENNDIIQKLNLRENTQKEDGIRKIRSKHYADAIQSAFEACREIRVIVLKDGENNSASGRLLDSESWRVVEYNYNTGAAILKRGPFISESLNEKDNEVLGFPEGQARRVFLEHRYREQKLRKAKILSFKHQNAGRLFCEVSNCGFEFEVIYGEIGHDFAHVHHLVPFNQLDKDGKINTVDDLAIVCPNCHSMIHRGGQCREMSTLITMRK